MGARHTAECQLWAVWALANLTTVCQIFNSSGLISILFLITFTFSSSSLSLSQPPGESGQVLPAGGGRGWSGPCRGDRQQQQVEIYETEICVEGEQAK